MGQGSGRCDDVPFSRATQCWSAPRDSARWTSLRACAALASLWRHLDPGLRKHGGSRRGDALGRARKRDFGRGRARAGNCASHGCAGALVATCPRPRANSARPSRVDRIARPRSRVRDLRRSAPADGPHRGRTRGRRGHAGRPRRRRAPERTRDGVDLSRCRSGGGLRGSTRRTDAKSSSSTSGISARRR